MNNDLKLSVRLRGKPIGILGQDAHGKLYFYYLEPFPNNQISISHSLPLSMEKRIFSESECKPFFEGLLPDSEIARQMIAAQHRISAHNTFQLLKVMGQDCPGAISFHTLNDPVYEYEFEKIDADFKTDTEIEAYIKKLPQYPLLHGLTEVRLSLAGVQNKIGVVYRDEKIGIPKKNTPSTHILKPEIDGFENSAFNEYFCLSLAKAAFLNAAEVSFRKIENTPCVILGRYDRSYNMEGFKRLHQEDFCQALGKIPTQKYENEGGPSLEDCFNLLTSVSADLALDRLKLLGYIIFNFIVGNTDAHGKNFSILYGFWPLPRLAPLYDALCCQIYSNHSQKMAMKIGGEYEAKNVFDRHWARFCASAGLSFPEFKKTTHELCQKVSQTMNRKIDLYENKIETPVGDLYEHERPYLPFTKELQCVIQGNIDTLLKRLSST